MGCVLDVMVHGRMGRCFQVLGIGFADFMHGILECNCSMEC